MSRHSTTSHERKAAGRNTCFTEESTPSINKRSRDFWQKRTDRVLSDEDAREINANVYDLFSLLERWYMDDIASGHILAKARRQGK